MGKGMRRMVISLRGVPYSAQALLRAGLNPDEPCTSGGKRNRPASGFALPAIQKIVRSKAMKENSFSR